MFCFLSLAVRIAQDDVVWKVPSTQQYTDDSTVGFHQDSAYISNQFEPYDNNSVTLWIALDDADECNGCLEYSVGSQKWRPLLHRMNDHSNTTTSTESSEISDFHSSDSSSYRNGVSVAAQLAGVSQNIVEAVVVKEGFGVLHHQDVWHGSNANKSPTRHRRALVAHYIRGDLRFRQKGANYIYGRYKRHNSVVLDETFFPIIYGKERSKWLDDFLTK
jgi:ectoine hydroxylase-related dioxygenase (phytanoyl-CoA dioxygenase family)